MSYGNVIGLLKSVLNTYKDCMYTLKRVHESNSGYIDVFERIVRRNISD